MPDTPVLDKPNHAKKADPSPLGKSPWTGSLCQKESAENKRNGRQ